MSKTIRELINDARASGDWNAVADWCETYDWSPAEEIPIGEFVLWRDVRMRGHGEGRVVEAVAAARTDGTTWDRIGEILGIAGPEARQRYGAEIDETEAVSR